MDRYTRFTDYQNGYFGKRKAMTMVYDIYKFHMKSEDYLGDMMYFRSLIIGIPQNN